MQKLLVGYDGSDPAREAVRTAAHLARRLGATVTVLTAGYMVTPVSTTVMPTVDEMAFASIAEEGAELGRSLGAAIDGRGAFGEPAQALAELAAREGYDLVLVGHRGLGGIRELVLGSVAKKLATEAPCPVVVVRGPAPEALRKVLVAVDGSEHAQRALEAAILLARALAAHLTILHVLDPALFTAGTQVETMQQRRLTIQKRGLEILTMAGEACQRAGVGYEALQAEGRPADVIATWAQEREYDLVAVGRRGIGGLARLVLGSVSDAVLARATCPVLVAGEQR